VNAPTISGLPQVQRALLAWHHAQGMHAPWRESGDPYQVLVAAVMAQQTQMSRVMPSYERFIAAFPTVESLASATAGDVIRVWAGMGYNQRAIRLHRAAQTIVAGGWPRNAAALAKIDGIGPFTAAIIASFAFGEPAACVDTNVRRVLGRLSGDAGIDGKRLQSLADASLAAREPARWNQALMDYGARVCTVRPKCGECIVSRWCALAPGALAMVADERADYVARPRPKTQPKYEGSARWWRGRIVDALRALPPGASISVAALRRTIVNGTAPPSAAEVRTLVAALEAHGLVAVAAGRVRLPE
jgi:A/G-specific adenine glycosylase